MKKLMNRVCAVILGTLIMGNALAKDTIGLVIVSLDSPFFLSIQEGAQKEADRLGYNLIVLDSEKKFSKEQNNTQDLVMKGIKVLLVNPIDRTAMQSVINIADRARVPVVAVDGGYDNQNVTSTVTADSRIGAKVAGDFIANRLGGGAKVIQLEGPVSSTEAAKRNIGFLQAVKQHKLNLLASQAADYDRTKGLNLMQNLLLAHPNVQAVFAQNDEMALGALSALQVAGRNDVLVVGFDGASDAIKAVASGKLAATISQQPELLGKTSVIVADKIIRGEAVSPVVMLDSKLITL